MGPLLMTGLATFGGALAVGLIASSTSGRPGSPAHAIRQRSLAVVQMAFAEGIAVLGTVVGLLGVFLGSTAAASGGLLAALPGLGGAVLGLVVLVRERPTEDPAIARIAAAFVLGIGVLAVVVGTLASVIVERGTASPSDWPFAITGLAAAAAAIGLGLTAAAGLRSLPSVPEAELVAFGGRQVARAAIFQAMGVVASVAALALLLLG